MGPLINERASREDLIARIETLESTIAELVTDKHIDRRNIEIMINANTALKEENDGFREEIGDLSRRVYRLRHKFS